MISQKAFSKKLEEKFGITRSSRAPACPVGSFKHRKSMGPKVIFPVLWSCSGD